MCEDPEWDWHLTHCGCGFCTGETDTEGNCMCAFCLHRRAVIVDWTGQ